MLAKTFALCYTEYDLSEWMEYIVPSLKNLIQGAILMRVLRQISLIFLICVLCEGLASLLPFPFPGSVLSMIVLFFLFALKWIEPEDMKETSGLLLGNMMLVFVPSFVSIMNYFDVLRHIAVQFIFIIIVSTVVTFLVGGAVVSLVCRMQDRYRAKKEG